MDAHWEAKFGKSHIRILLPVHFADPLPYLLSDALIYFFLLTLISATQTLSYFHFPDLPFPVRHPNSFRLHFADLVSPLNEHFLFNHYIFYLSFSSIKISYIPSISTLFNPFHIRFFPTFEFHSIHRVSCVFPSPS